MMRFVIVILMFMILVSCNDTLLKEKTFREFPVVEELMSEIYPSPTPIFIPRFMGTTDDYLYIYKEREEKKIVVFHIPDMEYIGDMGNQGQGPNDFNLLDTRSFNPIEGGFQVVEAGSNIMKTVLLKEEGMVSVSSNQVLEKGLISNGFYSLKDSVFLSFGQIRDKNEYTLHDIKNDTLFHIGSYPDWCNLSAKDIPFVVYLKTCVVHPSKERIAVFYSKFKRMRIFDACMNLLHDVDLQTIPCNISPNGTIEETPIYYIGQPYATDEYIYALCCLNYTEKHGRSELHVWDWEGNPVVSYELGRKISLFAISEKHGKMYALNNEKENELYIYDLFSLKNTNIKLKE